MRQPAPKLKEWLKGYNTLLRKLESNGFKATSTNAREGLANLTYTLVTRKTPIDWIQDDLVEGDEFNVPVRIYHPLPDAKLPVLLYFHGGGHMAGNVSVYDPICRRIASAAHHIVVSADYRLAPECPYPAGINDALSVTKNIWQTLNSRGILYHDRLSIAGDSAGGAICATVSHSLQHDPAVTIDKQILIYPSLDYTMQADSIEQNGRGYLLEKEKIAWYFDNYFSRDEDREQCSPLFMEFSQRIPQSLVITAEFCPLRDEAMSYIRKLEESGVVYKHVQFIDMIHAFMNMEDLLKDQCDQLHNEIASFLNNGK